MEMYLTTVFPAMFFLLSGLNISFIGEHISDAVRRSDATDAGAQKQHDLLERCLVSSTVALLDVPQHHSGIDALQCLIASGLVELVFPQNGHTAELEILLKFFIHRHIRSKLIEVKELLEGQRQHSYFHISAGKQCGKLRREKIGVGDCDIDIYIKIQTERFDCFFPMLHRLQLVEHEVGFPILGDMLADMIVKGQPEKSKQFQTWKYEII